MNGVAFTDRPLIHDCALPLSRHHHLSLQAVMAEADDTDMMVNYHGDFLKSDRKSSRYPYCVVWTPIPILS